MKFTKTLFISILAALTLSAVSCGDENGPVNPAGPDDSVQLKPGNTMVVYEANPKLFASSKSLKAIEDRLDEIQDLGVNVIWLMPIQPIGSDKTSVGSPYCIKDFKGVNPSYGTIDDLKSLVSKAHSMGMKVILDWIANHTSWVSLISSLTPFLATSRVSTLTVTPALSLTPSITSSALTP